MTLPRRALLAVLPALAACAGNLPPSPEELAAVHAGSRAVLLLRLVGTDQHGTSRQPLAMDWGHDPVIAEWGDFDSGGAPRPWRRASPSDQAWRDGWVMMVLPPGQYYLHIRPLRLAEPGLVWRIEVPRGAQLLYAGTLALGETTAPGIFTTLWLGLDPARTGVRDESAAAAALAARDLPGLPPPRTRLMQPHSGPVRLGVPA